MKRREDKAHLQRIRSLPCMCCEADGVEQTSRTEAHHVRRDEHGRAYGMGQKAHDDETIPLCSKVHHWNGVHSRITRAEFEERYGNERDLLQRIREQL